MICTSPTMATQEYLTRGHAKSVPVDVVGEAMATAGIPYFRVTNFGWKQAVPSFPELSAALMDAHDAVDNGFPPNMWDVAYQQGADHMHAVQINSRARLPDGTKLQQYVLYTPLDTRMDDIHGNHGGSITFEPASPHVLKVKIYNVLYHLLRAYSTRSGRQLSPITSIEATNLLVHYRGLLRQIEENPLSVGGFRVEIRVPGTTLEETIQLVEFEQLFDIEQYLGGARFVHRALSIFEFQDQLRERFDEALAILAQTGVTYHRGNRRGLTVGERMIMGDIRSLFGYSTQGSYRTDPISLDAWWRTGRREVPQEEDRGPGAHVVGVAELEGEDAHIGHAVYTVQVAGRRIPWRRALIQFRRECPESTKTDEQVKNRFKHLRRRGLL